VGNGLLIRVIIVQKISFNIVIKYRNLRGYDSVK